MTHPTDEELDTLVKRLTWHREHPVTGKLVYANEDGPDASAVITALRAALADSQPADPDGVLHDPDGHWGDFLRSAVQEAEKAMRKFPKPNYVISKVAEEAGEVVKAAIHAAEGRETLPNLRAEMRQLVAMLYRLWVEGDAVHGLPPVSSALAASLPADPVTNAGCRQPARVKPLVWEDFGDWGAKASAYYQANYLIQFWKGREQFEVALSYPGHQTGYDGDRWHPTLDAAKAAAQADYEARVLAALEPAPTALAEVATAISDLGDDLAYFPALAEHGLHRRAYDLAADIRKRVQAEPIPVTLADALKVPEVQALVDAARKLEKNLGVKGVDVGSLRVDLYHALAAFEKHGEAS